jgi:hypothetical protein
MLGSGAALGGILWHLLMADGRGRVPASAAERLTPHDRQALDGLFEHGSQR